MKRYPLILIVVILAGLLRPFSVSAQGDPTVLRFEFEGHSGTGSAQGWYYDAAFIQQSGSGRIEGFTLDDGTIDADLDPYCDAFCIISGGSQNNSYLTAVYSLGSDVEIDHIAFQWKNKTEGVGSYMRVRVYNSAMEIVYNAQNSIGASWSGEKNFDLTTGDPIIGRYVVIHAYHSWNVAIDWVEITVSGLEEEKEDKQYVYPLTQGLYTADLYTWDSVNDILLDVTEPLGPNFEMLGYASDGIQLVHAPVAGVVVDIEPLTTCARPVSGSMSDALGSIASLISAIHPLAGAVAGVVQYADMLAWQSAGDATYCSIFPLAWNNIDLLDYTLNYYYIPKMGDIVTMQASQTGDFISYLVMDSEYFVEVGTPIAAGCVIGITLPIWWGRVIPAPTSYSENGFGAIWATDINENAIDIFERYNAYPTANTPCNAATFEGCLNENPGFSYYGAAEWGWAFDGVDDRNPEGETEGLLLTDTGNNNASQAIILNTETAYSIKIVTHVQEVNDTFTDSDIIVSLGTTDHTITVPEDGTQIEIVTDPQVYTPDLGGGVYTLRVALAAGEDGAEVVVSYICVDDNADPISPLPSCLFSNPSFDSPSDWTLDDATISGGALLLPESATQGLDLAADTYSLEVRARGPAGGTQTVSIAGTGAGASFGNFGGTVYWQAQSFTPASDGQITEVVVTHTANVGSPAGTATMEIRSNSTSSPGSVLWSGTYTPTASAANTISVAAGPDLTGGTVYWLVFRSSSPQSSGNGWTLDAAGTGSYSGGNRAYSTNSGSTWTGDNVDIDAEIELNAESALSWSIDGGTLADGAISVGEQWTTYTSDSFAIVSPVTAVDFEISSGLAIDVDYVCLIPGNQPTAPPVPDYPDVRDCNSCPIRLTGASPGDIVETLQWQDCRARQIYYCDFRKLMVDTRDGVYETVRGVGMLGRWLAASATKQMTWLRSAFWYLGGLLNNVALSIQDSIAWSSGANTLIISDSPMGFWDVLGLLITGLRDVLVTTMESLVETVSMLLGFLTPIVGTLLDVITAAVSMFTSFISAVLDQLGIVHYLIAAIIDGANNATPETIAGAPSCTTTPEGICWGFYVLDNTLFSGPVADLLPILAGAATLNLLVWVLGKFRDAFASLS